MGLLGIRGEHVDRKLMLYALAHTPSLVLDCANSANLHALYPHASPEAFRQAHVITIDAIYRFRDALEGAGSWAERLEARTIVVTSYDRLFSYDDAVEKEHVLSQAWETIVRLSQRYDVVVPYREGCKEVDMGHTVWSARVATDELIAELNDFAKALSREDRIAFERLLKEPLKHISKLSYTSSMHMWAFFLLCVMIEQEKRSLSLRVEHVPEHDGRHHGREDAHDDERHVDVLLNEACVEGEERDDHRHLAARRHAQADDR
jgi:hypothetical protein